MHNPEYNPATSPGLNGKTRRYANGTVATRHVRLDHQADLDLTQLQRILTGHDDRDIVSVSLVCRRALAVFRDHEDRLDRLSLAHERQCTRRNSHLPKLADTTTH